MNYEWIKFTGKIQNFIMDNWGFVVMIIVALVIVIINVIVAIIKTKDEVQELNEQVYMINNHLSIIESYILHKDDKCNK